MANVQTGMEERRRHPRFPRGDLNVQIHRSGWAGVWLRSPATRCVNFSRSGLQVECDQSFKVGDTLIVDLLLNDISVEELCAKVCSVRTSAGQPNRYGLRFCFEDARHMRSPRTAHALKQIEACLRTHSGYS